MKLVSTKLPKKTKDEMEKTAPMMPKGERWPYGLRLTFESDQIDKLPQLERVKIGQKLLVEGIGEVTSIQMHEEKEGKKKYSVEVQLQEVGCEGMGKLESMGEAMGRSNENRRL